MSKEKSRLRQLVHSDHTRVRRHTFTQSDGPPVPPRESSAAPRHHSPAPRAKGGYGALAASSGASNPALSRLHSSSRSGSNPSLELSLADTNRYSASDVKLETTQSESDGAWLRMTLQHHRKKLAQLRQRVVEKEGQGEGAEQRAEAQGAEKKATAGEGEGEGGGEAQAADNGDNDNANANGDENGAVGGVAEVVALEKEMVKLQALQKRVESGDEAALREVHAMRALGIFHSPRSFQRSDSWSVEEERGDRESGAAGEARGRVADAKKEGGLLRGSSRKRFKLRKKKKMTLYDIEVTKPPSPWNDLWLESCAPLADNEWQNPYPDVSQMDSPLIVQEGKAFSLELGGQAGTLAEVEGGLRLEDAQSFQHLYNRHFVNRPHALYLGRNERMPVAVMIETEEEQSGDRGQYRTLILTKHGYKKEVLRSSISSRDRLKQLKKHTLLANQTLRKPTQQSQLSTQLMIFEKKRIVHHAKVGVLYRKAGQTKEEEIFSNQHGSPQFFGFLQQLGTVIDLKGHTRFRGGLDVRDDLTGKKSVFSTLRVDETGRVKMGAAAAAGDGGDELEEGDLEFEIMFHVGPFLPHSPDNPQQIHKKRHIGNDIVVIIFSEADEPFDPSIIKSNYNHVFIVVTPLPNDPTGRKKPAHYRAAVACVRGVKPFRPSIPNHGLIPAKDIGPWLLTKALNAEAAAMYAPEFAQKTSRTIQKVLGSFVAEM